jgi:hypothetical protein
MTQIGKNGHVDHICIQEESCANHRHGGRHLPTEILTVTQQIHGIFIITGTSLP